MYQPAAHGSGLPLVYIRAFRGIYYVKGVNHVEYHVRMYVISRKDLWYFRIVDNSVHPDWNPATVNYRPLVRRVVPELLELATAIAMLSVDSYVCMGCQSGDASGGYFDTYKAAACHYSRSKPCQQSGRAIKYIQVQSNLKAWRQGRGGFRRSRTMGATAAQLLERWYIAYYITNGHLTYHTLALV